ncbi:MAG: ABC transporter ATP-binding protein [Gammaproteobacteria bacterium]|jgi:ATP-binding cassette subfamily B protein
MNQQSLPKTLLPFIWHFVKNYRLAFAVFLFVPMLLIFQTTVQPYAIKLIVDGLTMQTGTDSLPQDVINGVLLYMLIFALIVVIVRSQEWYQAIVIPKFLADIRMSVLGQLSQQSYQYFSNHMAGKLANKVSDLPAAIDEMRLIFCWNVIAPLMIALSSVIVIALVSPWASFAFFIWMVIHIGIAFWWSDHINAKALINAEHKSQLSGLTVDFLANMIPVKLFARRSYELNYIQNTQNQEKISARASLNSINILRLFMDILSFFMVCAMFLALFYTWKKGLLTPGDVAFVLMSMIAAWNQLWLSGQMLANFFRQMGIAQQALDIISAPIVIQDISDAKPLVVSQGSITFDNVSFQYHDERALFSNKNVVIQAGEKVGLVGYSGSGKTTFANLILRFYDTLGGRILIDGQDISHVTQDSLHEQITMVPQDTNLFHRTLYENIQFADPSASEQEILAASKAAHCHEFIEPLPEGYQTLVGERGLKLSGGQRQRIAIARAMLKKAPILILDEATSALDYMTEQYIQESLKKLMHNKTMIVIAHRLSTLAHMDRILVFDQGHIIEEGNHASLLAQKGLYAHLWRMQEDGFIPELNL